MRRSGIRGVLAGALALVALQVLVSSGSRRLSGLLGAPGVAAQWWLDPTIPAIPETRSEEEQKAVAKRRKPVGGTFGTGTTGLEQKATVVDRKSTRAYPSAKAIPSTLGV